MAKSTQNQAQARNKPQSKAAQPTDNQQKGQFGQGGQGFSQMSPQSAVELLKQDHRRVEQLFEEFEQADDEDRQQDLAHRICKELMVHAMIEEEIFYPACRSAADEDKETAEKLDEAQVEHDSAKILINEILRGEPDDEFWRAKVCVLKDQIFHHVEEEEKPDEGVLAKAQEEGVDTADLANRLMRRKNELMSRADDMRPARAVSLMQPMHHMARGRMGRGYPERDERGRFMSEDDDRGYGRLRGRYEDEDDLRGRGWYAERRSRYEDEDERDARRPHYQDEDDYGRGGWYGDPRGHAEAARRGWDERRGARYEDEDDDYRRGGRGGWFGDSRGHAEASRRGWQHRR